MRTVTTIIIIFFAAHLGKTQEINTQHVRGKVFDAETHQPLEGAYVRITNISPAKTGEILR